MFSFMFSLTYSLFLEAGYALDVVTGTCQPDVPVSRRGCYPRETCDAAYAARFCAHVACLPQGFNGECGAMAKFTGHGVAPNMGRSDLFDVDGGVGGASATFPEARTNARTRERATRVQPHDGGV